MGNGTTISIRMMCHDLRGRGYWFILQILLYVLQIRAELKFKRVNDNEHLHKSEKGAIKAPFSLCIHNIGFVKLTV